MALLNPTQESNEAHLKKGGVQVLELLLRRSQRSVDALEPHPQLTLGIAQRLVQASDGIQLALELFDGRGEFNTFNTERKSDTS